jgi:hypothetical protein
MKRLTFSLDVTTIRRTGTPKAGNGQPKKQRRGYWSDRIVGLEKTVGPTAVNSHDDGPRNLASGFGRFALQ